MEGKNESGGTNTVSWVVGYTALPPPFSRIGDEQAISPPNSASTYLPMPSHSQENVEVYTIGGYITGLSPLGPLASTTFHRMCHRNTAAGRRNVVVGGLGVVLLKLFGGGGVAVAVMSCCCRSFCCCRSSYCCRSSCCCRSHFYHSYFHPFYSYPSYPHLSSAITPSTTKPLEKVEGSI
jgi:hypothetical protein